MMNHNQPTIWPGALLMASSALLASNAFAWPSYVQLTGAKDCASCHITAQGNGYLPGILAAARSSQGVIEGLKAFLREAGIIEEEQEVTKPNTAPVLHPINAKWDVTVGEQPLIVPLQVSDKEDDTFALHGSAPSGYSTSRIYSKNNLATIDFRWSPTAAQANKNYFINVFVQETGDGRNLKSNLISANIQVWPARESQTKQVGQFLLQAAQWKGENLNLSGQLFFKKSISPALRRKALSTLTMEITSASGIPISQAVKLKPNNKGSWTSTLTLGAGETPCVVKVSYEGLIAARPVSQALAGTCVK